MPARTRRVRGPSRQWPARPRDVPAEWSWRSRLLGLPEDLGDFLDLGEQLVSRGRVGRRLRPAGAAAGQLGGLVEQAVQLRVLLEVVRLEVVGPQHPEV